MTLECRIRGKEVRGQVNLELGEQITATVRGGNYRVKFTGDSLGNGGYVEAFERKGKSGWRRIAYGQVPEVTPLCLRRNDSFLCLIEGAILVRRKGERPPEIIPGGSTLSAKGL